jgi:hypothetical protein
MVIGRSYSGSSGTYFRAGSSRLSLPSATSTIVAAAVNCLATEPDSKIVSAVFATPASRFAIP